MTFFLILISIKVILLGAVYGRLDGGGLARVNEWIERSLIMFFFVLACAPFADLWALCAYAGVVGIATGHGQYFLDRGIKFLGDTKERVDPFVSLFFGKDPRTGERFRSLSGAAQTNAIRSAIQNYGNKKLYWRCVFGLFITGSLVGIPATVLALCYGQFFAAFIFSLTGVNKALWYAIGYQLKRMFPQIKDTVVAEYGNGGGRNALCLAVILTLIPI